MASKACSSCLGAIPRQSPLAALNRKLPRSFTASRAFTTTRQCTVNTPPNNSISRTPKRPVTRSTAASSAQQPNSADEKTAKPTINPKKFTGVIGTYSAFGATDVLYKLCMHHADYRIPEASDPKAEIPTTEDGVHLGVGEGWWHTEFGMPATFTTWTQVTMLHMYLLAARFRCFPPDVAKTFQQQFLDHFFYDAEEKLVVTHAMHSRGARNKLLKDLFLQWRGLLLAYDEGVARGDAVLAGAVWRNIFMQREDVDLRQLAMVVAFMRRTLKEFDALDDMDVMTAVLDFGSIDDEKSVVALKSKSMDISPPNKAPTKKRTPPAAKSKK